MYRICSSLETLRDGPPGGGRPHIETRLTTGRIFRIPATCCGRSGAGDGRLERHDSSPDPPPSHSPAEGLDDPPSTQAASPLAHSLAHSAHHTSTHVRNGVCRSARSWGSEKPGVNILSTTCVNKTKRRVLRGYCNDLTRLLWQPEAIPCAR